MKFCVEASKNKGGEMRSKESGPSERDSVRAKAS